MAPGVTGSGGNVSRIVAMTLGVGLAVLPISLHQTRTSGSLQLLTANGGLNLFIGNNPAARGIYSSPPELDIHQDFSGRRSASNLAGRELTLMESSEFWRNRAFAFFVERPARAAWLLGRKALLFLSPRETPQIENFSRVAADTPSLRLAFLRFGWILPLAVLGVVLGPIVRDSVRSPQEPGARPAFSKRRPGRRAHLWPFLALVLTGWIATLVFFAAGRYRIPILPGFFALAAIGCEQLWRRRRDVRSLAPAVLIVALVAGGELFLPGYPVARAGANADYLLALRLGARQQHEESVRIFERALRQDPALSEAWHGIGVARAEQGRLQEAVAAYERALELDPRSTWTHYNLALCLGRMGLEERATEELGLAVSLEPRDANLRYRYGAALGRLGRYPEARDQLRQAVAIDPALSEAQIALRALDSTIPQQAAEDR
jgi:tetratricopeptide (TPR) repeat protein